MRKTQAILLLLLTLTTFIGGRVLFVVEQVFIKCHQEKLLLQKLPDSALLDVTDMEPIIWEEEGKEFYFHGELYDIIRTHTENGRTHFLSIKDGDETNLIKNYAKQIPGQGKRPQQRSGSITYYFEHIQLHINPLVSEYPYYKPYYLVSIPDDLIQEILIPPPNC